MIYVYTSVHIRAPTYTIMRGSNVYGRRKGYPNFTHKYSALCVYVRTHLSPIFNTIIMLQFVRTELVISIFNNLDLSASCPHTFMPLLKSCALTILWLSERCRVLCATGKAVNKAGNRYLFRRSAMALAFVYG